MRSMRGVLGSLLLVSLLAAALFAEWGSDSGPVRLGEAGGPRSADALVTRVVDGDTVEVRIAGGRDEVRYIGIDTPETVKPGEPVQCFGHRASAANRRLVEGRRVRLVFDRERRDVYGRLLAYVYVRGRFVNAELVR